MTLEAQFVCSWKRSLHRNVPMEYWVSGGKRVCADRPVRDPVWLSAHEILAHTSHGDGATKSVYRVRVPDGRATFAESLDREIDAMKDSAWQISPDRRWILYRSGWFNPHTMVAATVSGNCVHSWKIRDPMDERTPFFWVPGTQRWWHLWSPKDAPDRPSVARLYALGRSAPLREHTLPPLPTREFLGCTPDGEAILADICGERKAPPTTHLELVAFRVADGGGLRRWRVAIGSGDCPVCDALLAPDGRTIAYRRGGFLWTVGLHGGAARKRCEARHPLLGWQPGTDRLCFYDGDEAVLYRLNARL